MGVHSSKYDDKDDDLFINLEVIPFYNDDYVCSIDDKIITASSVATFDDFVQGSGGKTTEKIDDSLESQNNLMTSLATMFCCKFDRLVTVEDFSGFSASVDMNLALEFMRGRRNLLLDRVFQSQSNMLGHLRAMNESSNRGSGSGGSSLYWNLPSLPEEEQVGYNAADEDKTIALLLSLNMSLSLAKALGGQSQALMAAVLRGLLESFLALKPVSLRQKRSVVQAMLNPFVSFSLNLATNDATASTETKSLALSLLFVLGLLRGSMAILSRVALLLLDSSEANEEIGLDAMVKPWLQFLKHLEPKYSMVFPEGLSPSPDRIPLSLPEDSNKSKEDKDKEEKSGGSGGGKRRSLCAASSHHSNNTNNNNRSTSSSQEVFILDDGEEAVYRVSAGGRGVVAGDCLAVNRDLLTTLRALPQRQEFIDDEAEDEADTSASTAGVTGEQRVKVSTVHRADLFQISEEDEPLQRVHHHHPSDDRWDAFCLDTTLPRRPSSQERELLTGRAYYEITVERMVGT